MISPLCHFFGSLLYVDHIGIFDKLVEFVHLDLLHIVYLAAESVEKPYQLLPNLISQVEVLALDQRHLLCG